MSKLQEMVKDREAWRAAVHAIAEPDPNEQMNNSNKLKGEGERIFKREKERPRDTAGWVGSTLPPGIKGDIPKVGLALRRGECNPSSLLLFSRSVVSDSL